jgi:hypothetical protein
MAPSGPCLSRLSCWASALACRRQNGCYARTRGRVNAISAASRARYTHPSIRIPLDDSPNANEIIGVSTEQRCTIRRPRHADTRWRLGRLWAEERFITQVLHHGLG